MKNSCSATIAWGEKKTPTCFRHSPKKASNRKTHSAGLSGQRSEWAALLEAIQGKGKSKR